MDVTTYAATRKGATVTWTESCEIGDVDYVARRTTSGEWAVRGTEDTGSGPRELEVELWDTHKLERHSGLNLCPLPCCR